LGIIAELSKNDENSVLAQKVGSLHGQYDKDIFEVSAIKKNDGEKTYDYMKRAMGTLKDANKDTDKLKTEVSALKTQKTELEKQLAEHSGDTTLKQKLADTETALNVAKQSLIDKDTEFKTKEAEYTKNLQTFKFDSLFNQATTGLKFKNTVPESVKPIILQAVKNDILGKGVMSFEKNDAGQESLIFRDNTGQILINKNNKLNPYTLQDYVNESSALKDVLEQKIVHTGGGGGNPPANPNHGSTTLDLSGAKTQVEADVMIEKHLMENGITMDDPSFADKEQEIRTENKVSELPVR